MIPNDPSMGVYTFNKNVSLAIIEFVNHRTDAPDPAVERLVEALEAKITRLEADNAALWERVKRWEPGADPAQFGSGTSIPAAYRGKR